MKRSEINKALKELEAMCQKHCCYLPPFCHFTPEEWEQKQIGPYHEKATLCEKKFVCGGLIGPVVLFEKG